MLTSPGVLLFAGLAVVALVAERSLSGSVLSGSAILGGGALVPSWGGAGRLWHEYLAGYHDTGIGSAASTPAYIGGAGGAGHAAGRQAVAGHGRAAARLRAAGGDDGVSSPPGG